MKSLLKNVKIYDGTGAAPYIGDILIEGDRIARIGTGLTELADHVIDLSGKAISSGFIDGHSHNDWFAIKKDSLPYFAPFIRQGIVSFVAGNCGLSTVGFEPGSPYVDKLGGGLFGFRDTVGKFGTVEEFFEAVDQKMPCNMALLAGHCSARAAVSGYSNRKLTHREEQDMLAILEKALQQGAAGLSLGMMYEPGLYADVEELKKVARERSPKFPCPIRSCLAARISCALSMSWWRFQRAPISSCTIPMRSLSGVAPSKIKMSC